MKPDVICPHCKKGMTLHAQLIRSIWGRYRNSLRKHRGGGRPRKVVILDAVSEPDLDSGSKAWEDAA